MRVRFRVRAGHRRELAEATGPDLQLGSSPECQVILHHPSVADVHGHVLVRRGNLIVRSSGRRRSQLGTDDGASIAGPTIVRRGTVVRFGDLRVEAWLDPRPGLALAQDPQSGIRELESDSARSRRYRLDHQTEASFMRATPAHRTWLARTAATSAPSSQHVCRRTMSEEVDGHLFVKEHVESGLRLALLMTAIQRGLFELSASAAVVIAGHAALGLTAYHAVAGAHGAVDPEHLHVGADGSTALVAPGPSPELDFAFAAPERRLGLAASRPADAFAWGRITMKLLRLAGAQNLSKDTLTPLLTGDPRRRIPNVVTASEELQRALFAAGHDAGAQDVGRLVRLLVEDSARPLVEIGRRNPPVSINPPANHGLA